MQGKQGIVIQGPTNYCEQIINCYSGLSGVVFSTWEDEPRENIEFIRSAGIEVVQTRKPDFSGYLNINYQTLSTYAGLKRLKEIGVTEALKIRGDLKPNNVIALLDALKGNSLSFLAICRPGVRPLNYELEYFHDSFDFPVDLFLYGSIENLEKCFGFQTRNDLKIPPESLIAYNYFVQSKIPFRLDYSNFIKNGVNFFMHECLEKDIEVMWLKHDLDLIKMHSDPLLYEY
jgi:hypothetical protein